MVWIIEEPLNWLQKFCINVLKCGPVPKHVAFIMDGNRRYATKTKVNKFEGHSRGFDKLAETLQWCLELGITEVTVYAFSIENFKRSKDEVDALMTLAREKFQKVFEEKQKLMEAGVCIRVIGNLSLLPPDLCKLIAEAMVMTKDNKKTFLNVAFAYTSRDEITTAMRDVIQGVKDDQITVDDITENLLENCLFTNHSDPPDVLVRTSEIRLSDFLLWQVSSNSLICFTQVLWPEFSIWHFLGLVFKYQRNYEALKDYNRKNYQRNDRVEKFIGDLHERRFSQLVSYANS